MVIFDGKIYQQTELPSAMWNRSFRYGDGLFETIRVYQGGPILLQDHFERLMRGMALLGYQVNWEEWEYSIRSSIHELLEKQEVAGAGRLRLHVWRSGGGTYRPEQDTPHYLLEHGWLSQEFFREPIIASLADYHGSAVYPTALSCIKTASALPYVLAARHARDAGTSDAVIYNHKGQIIETSASNIFIVKGTTITTPPIGSGCLDGVMRKNILRILESLPYQVEESAIPVKKMIQADAVFLTNSIRGIQAVSEFKGRKWEQEDWKHVLFLQKTWLNRVEFIQKPWR